MRARLDPCLFMVLRLEGRKRASLVFLHGLLRPSPLPLGAVIPAVHAVVSHTRVVARTHILLDCARAQQQVGYGAHLLCNAPIESSTSSDVTPTETTPEGRNTRSHYNRCSYPPHMPARSTAAGDARRELPVEALLHREPLSSVRVILFLRPHVTPQPTHSTATPTHACIALVKERCASASFFWSSCGTTRSAPSRRALDNQSTRCCHTYLDSELHLQAHVRLTQEPFFHRRELHATAQTRRMMPTNALRAATTAHFRRQALDFCRPAFLLVEPRRASLRAHITAALPKPNRRANTDACACIRTVSAASCAAFTSLRAYAPPLRHTCSQKCANIARHPPAPAHEPRQFQRGRPATAPCNTASEQRPHALPRMRLPHRGAGGRPMSARARSSCSQLAGTDRSGTDAADACNAEPTSTHTSTHTRALCMQRARTPHTHYRPGAP